MASMDKSVRPDTDILISFYSRNGRKYHLLQDTALYYLLRLKLRRLLLNELNPLSY